MPKLQSFDKPALQKLRQDILSSLKNVESEYGIQFSLGNIRFDSNSFSTKLNCILPSAGSEGKNATELVYANEVKKMPFYGLTEKDIDKEFSYFGKKYAFVGYKPNARKNFVVVRELKKGKLYLLPENSIELIKSAK